VAPPPPPPCVKNEQGHPLPTSETPPRAVATPTRLDPSRRFKPKSQTTIISLLAICLGLLRRSLTIRGAHALRKQEL
jgi:hypothetical protein